MNNENPSTIEVNKKTYQYDYEFDCYYRCSPQPPQTRFEKWRDISAGLIFLVLIVIFSHFFIHTA